MKRSYAVLAAGVLLIGIGMMVHGAEARSARRVAVEELSPPELAATLPDSNYRRQFVLSCTPCHQLRVPSSGTSVKDWEAVFAAMRYIDGPQYGTRLITDFDDHKMAQWVVASLRRAPKQQPETPDAARIREYPFGPHNGFYHDMEYAQGRAWIGDFFGNVLYGIDPASGQVTSIPIPPPKGWNKAMGVHTINRTRDGKLWMTFLATGQVARFDPATSQFTFYGGFDPHSHVHSFALGPYGYLAEDAQGRIWVTHFTEEYLSRLDPATGAIERFELPHSEGFEPEQVHPYAVSMDTEGRLWYTKLQSNVLGVLNPATRQVQEFRMPRVWSGPRRLGIDGEGLLWIPEYTTNRVTVFDTRQRRIIASYRLPSKGDYPYALRVHEQTGEVWITGTGTDSLYRFNPRTKRFQRYALPSSVAYTRMVTFDEQGDIWTVYGSFPNTFGPYTSGVAVKLEVTD